jgi:hypothetical protein
MKSLSFNFALGIVLVLVRVRDGSNLGRSEVSYSGYVNTTTEEPKLGSKGLATMCELKVLSVGDE